MHLIESFALSCGTTISKCFIQDEATDIVPIRPYITVHPFNGKGRSRQYLYWQNVIDELNNNQIFFDSYDIIQIGIPSDVRLNGVNTSYLNNKLTYNNTAYLIKNCSLHTGFDSFPVHLASHYGKKIVGIYQNHISNTGPYFSKPEDVILFQSDHNSVKPFYQEDNETDQDKLNRIDYKNITASILKLLNIRPTENIK
jgi:ADP-heptose:LPS heptosyltransferase